MLFISCPDSFVPLLLLELDSLGIREAKAGFCGVFVPQTMENVYTINYRSRIATRVLWQLRAFTCDDRHALYREALQVDWTRYLKLGQTFAIDANVAHPNLKNSLFAAQVMKDAICDQFKQKFGERPSVNVAEPDVQFNLFIHGSRGSISLDTSGIPLHKRGYRKEGLFAPIQESIAAALLAEVGYNSDEVLCDPFCGSGTFLIEAAMRASNTPAGFFRKTWGFVHHPEFNAQKWNQVKAEADRLRKPLAPGSLIGADGDPQAVKLCRTHAKLTGFAEAIDISHADIQNHRPLAPTLILTNPPYGKRLTTTADTYAAIGRFVTLFRSSVKKAYILTSEPKLAHATRLRSHPRLTFKNGGLPVTLYSLS